MIESIIGKLDASAGRYAIVAARFNDFIVTRLVDAAVDTLVRHGASRDNLTQIWAPGCFELPLVAQQVGRARGVDAIVCVGCLIRGQTPHFEHIAAHCARGIGQVGLELGKPVTFGVITADTMEQAIDRAGGKSGNKGAEAALAAIETLAVLNTLGGKSSR